jgi:hypothetical protein
LEKIIVLVDAIGLQERWLSGDFSACETLVSGIAPPELARRATIALSACCTTVSTPDEVRDVVRIGQQDWTKGHAAFDAVRQLTLEGERQRRSASDPSFVMLFVAENAAKVIYNASVPVDPFDDDSGAWLLLTLARLVQCLPPAEKERLSRALISCFVLSEASQRES